MERYYQVDLFIVTVSCAKGLLLAVYGHCGSIAQLYRVTCLYAVIRQDLPQLQVHMTLNPLTINPLDHSS
jgi:hypothetical protein